MAMLPTMCVACDAAAISHKVRPVAFEMAGSDISTVPGSAGETVVSSWISADEKALATEEQTEEEGEESDRDLEETPKKTLTLPPSFFGKRKTCEVRVGKVTDSLRYKFHDDGKLGEGAFGTVRLAVFQNGQSTCTSGAERAVKTINIHAAKKKGVNCNTLIQELIIHSEASEAQRDLSALKPPVLTQ